MPREFWENGDPYGIRTRVTYVKGRCPRPLDEGVDGRRSHLGRPPGRAARPGAEAGAHIGVRGGPIKLNRRARALAADDARGRPGYRAAIAAARTSFVPRDQNAASRPRGGRKFRLNVPLLFRIWKSVCPDGGGDAAAGGRAVWIRKSGDRRPRRVRRAAGSGRADGVKGGETGFFGTLPHPSRRSRAGEGDGKRRMLLLRGCALAGGGFSLAILLPDGAP